MKCFFFSGTKYIRVTRDEIGAGTIDPGYPAPISNWGWGDFAKGGIDAALFSGSKCYFFSEDRYIRVTRGETGAGTIDEGYPKPLSEWKWGDFGTPAFPPPINVPKANATLRGPVGPGIGKHGIDAALYSGAKCYFFAGAYYIRVSRGDTDVGTVDPGYPAPISNWGWGEFGKHGINAALYSGSKCYFFSGADYIRVTRGEIGPGTVDTGYPRPISEWGWGEFGRNGISDALYSGRPIKHKPAAPTDLRVTGTADRQISVAWNDMSVDEDSFAVRYSGKHSGDSDHNGTVSAGANATSSTITGLRAGYTYTIGVTARNSAGESASSNQVTATLPERSIALTQRSGAGASTTFTVSGSGFSPGKLVVIRLVDPQLQQFQTTQTSGGDGKFATTFPFPCVSGVQFTITAFEDADPVGTQSNAVVTTCP